MRGLTLLVMLPGLAWADLGVGARVGGYGFREPEHGEMDWQGCRMDGVGVFATWDLDAGRNLFLEGGLDFYQATNEVVEEEHMDRLSLHATAAVGVRLFPDAIVSPSIQAGLGAEWTKLELMHATAKREGVMPTGFLGVGGELNATERLHFGANLRFHAMQGPDLDHDAPGDDIPLAYRAVAQAQFFMRYSL
jgi:hypothetical protein